MENKRTHAMTALLVFLLLGIVSLWATGNLHIGPVVSASAAADEHPAADACADAACDQCAETEAPAPNSGADHATARAPADIDAILATACEHTASIADCDDCRYEVGLVKIGPAVSTALVETDVVSERTVGESLKLTGRIEFDQTRVVEVAAAADGRVIAIEKLLGQKVKAGDVLAVIQSADLGLAKADWLETNAQLELAEATFAREKQLYDKQIASQADFLTAQNELRRAAAALTAAEKKLNLMGLDAEQIAAIDADRANPRFAELVLRAPADGAVIEQNVIAGKLVDSADTLFTIADLSNLWVWCDLYERDFEPIHARFAEGNGVKASIRVAAFPNKVFEGTLDLIDSKLNVQTRTIRVRLSIANPDGMLKVGMFADARIAGANGQVARVVPKSAVMTDEDAAFVFQQVKDDLWLRRDVVTGQEFDGYVEILSPLPADARIVAKGAFMLKSDIFREKMGAGCAH